MGKKFLADEQQIRPVQINGMGQGSGAGRIRTISNQERFFF
jgi:hypothetical protein